MDISKKMKSKEILKQRGSEKLQSRQNSISTKVSAFGMGANSVVH